MNQDKLVQEITKLLNLAYVKGYRAGRNGGKKKSRRRAFTPKTKHLVLLFQQNQCRSCGYYLEVAEFDHIDGDRSNNSPSNCQALCPNCHAKKSRGKL